MTEEELRVEALRAASAIKAAESRTRRDTINEAEVVFMAQKFEDYLAGKIRAQVTSGGVNYR